MNFNISITNQFKRDLKLIKARHWDINQLKEVIGLLANGQPLPAKFRDHALANNWRGYRECHIQPDWLLVYRVDGDEVVLVLSRTGTHSDLKF